MAVLGIQQRYYGLTKSKILWLNSETSLMNVIKFTDAKSLILELARHLDETRQCEETQICRKIKEMLNDKIKEGKITGKWIEECLPQEYKRKYAKSELSSLSRNAKKVGKILVDNEGKSLAESSSYESSNIDNIAHAHCSHADPRKR